MPPHLHPRSRMTTSLFTTTLMISFLVVATPHLLPCPVDNRAFADSADPEALRRRRRRRRAAQEDGSNEATGESASRKTVGEDWSTPKRECPVPKPGGLIGQVLGVRESNNEDLQVSVSEEVRRHRTRRKDGGDQE